MDNYYYNREVFKLISDVDELTKTIEELTKTNENLRRIINEQNDTIEYQKYLISSVISMN